MQSEELLEKAVKSAMLSVVKEHPMGHWRDDQVKEVARRAIIEAAQSATEPVGWQWRNPRWTVGGQWQHCPDGPREDKLPDTEYRPVYAAPPAPSVAVKALEWDAREDGSHCGTSSIGHYHVFPGTGFSYDLCGPVGGRLSTHKRLSEAKAAAQADYATRIRSALSAQVQDVSSDDDEETYQIGVRDGYSQAVQEIDRLTGGDGEYRYCTDHDPERHTPGPAEMIQRIVDRFETLNLIDDAEKRGDFWDAPGSAQVQDTHEQRTETCQRCQGNGEIVTDWERYRHPHENDVGDEAVSECPDCDGNGKVAAQVQDVAGSVPEEVREAATEVITAHECGMLRQTTWWENAAFLLAEYAMSSGDYAAAPAKQEVGHD
ncbi:MULTISPECIES: hypothetical protein [Agrobacterium]|uniref:hypothetical protein n=1 Tax=Agrobacterium tumefaciens TaxID=358 RepID=UPI001573DA19|nr:hypothetical protein [Agrobacterium tumefaciens]